jgi:hypothetical protein
MGLLGLGLLLACACSEGGKYSAMRPEYGGQAEFPSWPALQKGVVGYNLYLAQVANGPWEKINETPITGGRMMVPYLEPDREYFFRLTSVAANGAESRPGGAFKRKAIASKKQN